MAIDIIKKSKTRGPHSSADYVIMPCKGHPRTGQEFPEGVKKHISTLSLTSALDEGGWSKPRPGRVTPGKGKR